MSRLDEFWKRGFVKLEQVVPPDLLARLRENCISSVKPKREQGVTHVFTRDLLEEHPEFLEVPFLPSVVSAVREVMGQDYATVTAFSLASNMLNPGWHNDSQSQSLWPRPFEYTYHPDYLVAKCALYLQDHDPVYGGSLEVLPGSHRSTVIGYQAPLSRDERVGVMSGLQRRALHLRNKMLSKEVIQLSPGDLLLFHQNLWHRASQPADTVTRTDHCGVESPPEDKFKFLFMWDTCAKNQFLPIYLAHQLCRAKVDTSDSLYAQSLEVRYPEDYPQEVLERIAETGQTVAHFSEAPPDYTAGTTIFLEDGTAVRFAATKFDS